MLHKSVSRLDWFRLSLSVAQGVRRRAKDSKHLMQCRFTTKLLVRYFTNSAYQNVHWEDNCCLASQEIPHVLCNTEIDLCAKQYYASPRLPPRARIKVNVILPSTLTWPLQVFRPKLCWAFRFSCTSATRPANLSLFYKTMIMFGSIDYVNKNTLQYSVRCCYISKSPTTRNTSAQPFRQEVAAPCWCAAHTFLRMQEILLGNELQEMCQLVKSNWNGEVLVSKTYFTDHHNAHNNLSAVDVSNRLLNPILGQLNPDINTQKK